MGRFFGDGGSIYVYDTRINLMKFSIFGDRMIRVYYKCLIPAPGYTLM